MRRLYPEPAGPVDPADAYAVPAGGHRHLRVNMVSSADGAAAVAGRVGVLTGPADQALLRLLRALADVVMVGAGTVRAEGYGPLTVSPECAQRRAARGQLPAPPLAVVSRSLDLDLGSSAFAAATVRPLLLTCAAAPAERRAAAARVADVVVAGDVRVDLQAAVAALEARGLYHVLSEGGPAVLSELFATDLVDELCLAVSPVVVGGDATRITGPSPLPSRAHLRLAHVLEEEDFLFLRYSRG